MLHQTLHQKEDLIVRLIKENPQIIVKDMVGMVGNITSDVVKYYLKELKEKDSELSNDDKFSVVF